jgi:hypothetical protein
MPNSSSVPVILKRVAKDGNLGSTKATAGFSRTWCYTVLEMGRYIPTGAIICHRTLYRYFHFLFLNDQRDLQIPFYLFIFIFNSLHVSSKSCSSSGETSCINTTSGSCHSVSVVMSCAGRRTAHDTATDTAWQLPEVVLTQFVSLDDEHDVLETCRELKIKINLQKGSCVSSWSFTKNHFTIYDRQNIKFLVNNQIDVSIWFSKHVESWK